jgi:hypothetical protein
VTIAATPFAPAISEFAISDWMMCPVPPATEPAVLSRIVANFGPNLRSVAFVPTANAAFR